MQMTACTIAALRILTACGRAGDEQLTMPGMAEVLGIGEALVVKACHRLMRAGYLSGTRGRSGGYRLARDPASIVLIDVVRLFEDEADFFPCRLNPEGDCCIAPVCRLREICKQAWVAWSNRLASTTIADILTDPGEPALA